MREREREWKECGKLEERGELTCSKVVHIDLALELTRVPRSLPSDYRNAPLDLEHEERKGRYESGIVRPSFGLINPVLRSFANFS